MEIIVKEVCKFILEHIDEGITLEKLEKEFFYSGYYLMRIFKECTGYTIKEYENTIKVLKSINPLIFTSDTILKIAFNSGFNSQEYYSESFQNVIGVSPINFRKEYQEIDSIRDIKELEEKKEYITYLSQYQMKLLNTPNELEKVDKVKKLIK